MDEPVTEHVAESDYSFRLQSTVFMKAFTVKETVEESVISVKSL